MWHSSVFIISVRMFCDAQQDTCAAVLNYASGCGALQANINSLPKASFVLNMIVTVHTIPMYLCMKKSLWCY